MDISYAKQIGIAAAYKGASVLRSYFGKTNRVRKKGAVDLVTEADIASEHAIIETIKGVFPDHTIWAEESGVSRGHSRFQWIVDPLDGTTNFAHRVAAFVVSIAFSISGDIVIGIVLNPLSGELFTALKGEGAQLNGSTVEVSETKTVSDSLLATGFPYNRREHIDELLMRFSKCLKASQGIRRFGSAALDLCHVACGRFDGYWEQNLNPWDSAAGALIAAEAGAIVTDFSNRPFAVEKKEILAATPGIHHEMLKLVS